MKRFIGILVILILVVVVGAEFFLPSYVNQKIANKVESTFHPSEQTISVSSLPSIKMLAGRIDTASGSVSNVTLNNGLTFESVTINVKNLTFSPWDLVKNNEVTVESVGNGALVGTVSESALTTFLQSKIKGIENAQVHIKNNMITLTGTFDVGGFLRGEAVATGTIELNKNVLVFAPHQLSINGVDIKGITSSVLKDVQIYDFTNFPVPVKAEKISSENGKLRIVLVPEGK